MLLVRSLLFVVVLATVCFSCAPPSGQSGSNDPTTATNAVEDSIKKLERSIKVQRRLDSLEKVFDLLAAKCVVSHDEFKDITFYQHKTTGGKHWPNRKTIYAECNSKGYYYLRSNYYADDWLFHSAVEVKIGDAVLHSGEIPTYSDQNRRDNDAGSVWENVTYNELGQAIIMRIAQDSQKRIVVRFQGQQYYDDVTLSQADKNAIKDIYELARTIGEIDYYKKEFEDI